MKIRTDRELFERNYFLTNNPWPIREKIENVLKFPTLAITDLIMFSWFFSNQLGIRKEPTSHLRVIFCGGIDDCWEKKVCTECGKKFEGEPILIVYPNTSWGFLECCAVCCSNNCAEEYFKQRRKRECGKKKFFLQEKKEK